MFNNYLNSWNCFKVNVFGFITYLAFKCSKMYKLLRHSVNEFHLTSLFGIRILWTLLQSFDNDSLFINKSSKFVSNFGVLL